MKVKEKYSNEFKRDVDRKTLKKYKNLMLEEKTYTGNSLNLPYSSYYLRDKSKTLMMLRSPDPSASSFAKDLFLKYDCGFRTFLMDLFDVLIGESEDFKGTYAKDDRISFKVNKKTGEVKIIAIEKQVIPTFLLGIINFDDTKMSLRVAENLVKYFRGEDVLESWREICE